jgi:hypothetical protein
MNMAKTVTANYQPATYVVTAKTYGAYGAAQGTITTTDTDPDIACAANAGTCVGSAANGSTVTLVASVPERTEITGWTGCTGVSADKRTCTVLVNAPKTVTANYQPTQHYVTVNPAGTGHGDVRSTGTDPEIICGTDLGIWWCTGWATRGSTITLTAVPRPDQNGVNSVVSSWTGCSSVSADKSTCTLTMNANKTVTATFALSPAVP